MKDDDDNYSTLDKYWIIGISVAIGAASVLLSRETLWQEITRGLVSAITTLAALGTTLFIFALYMDASRKELDLAKKYEYIKHIELSGSEHVIMIFVLGLLFGGLIAFVANLLVYAALMSGLQVADFVGTEIVIRRFKDAEKQTPRMSASVKASLNEYYVNRPHLLLRFLRLVGCVVALLLAIGARIQHSGLFAEVGWATMIFSVLYSERVLYGWRKARKDALAMHHTARAARAT